MQKLEERNTYTPTDIPHVCSNCDSSLNSPESRDSVNCLKTSSNNSDAALTEKSGQNLSKKQLSVYVLSMRGKPLMPTTPRKARQLLKKEKAKVVRRTPFTIQLNYNCGERKQSIKLICYNAHCFNIEYDSRFVNPASIISKGKIPLKAKAIRVSFYPLNPEL